MASLSLIPVCAAAFIRAAFRESSHVRRTTDESPPCDEPLPCARCRRQLRRAPDQIGPQAPALITQLAGTRTTICAFVIRRELVDLAAGPFRVGAITAHEGPGPLSSQPTHAAAQRGSQPNSRYRVRHGRKIIIVRRQLGFDLGSRHQKRVNPANGSESGSGPVCDRCQRRRRKRYPPRLLRCLVLNSSSKRISI
jgi:hypothetical protein